MNICTYTSYISMYVHIIYIMYIYIYIHKRVVKTGKKGVKDDKTKLPEILLI